MAKYKDPSAVLDYKFDWKAFTNGSSTDPEDDWLESGETISSHSVTVASGITLDSSSLANSNTVVVAWLSGGTAGTAYEVTCRITTNQGRTDERTGMVVVKNMTVK